MAENEKVVWNITVSNTTDRVVSAHLARRKTGDDLDSFVENAVRIALGLDARKSPGAIEDGNGRSMPRR